MSRHPIFRVQAARWGLLAAAVLHMAGAVVGPLLHGHELPGSASVYSQDDAPSRGTADPQFCEACTAHGAAVLPALGVATVLAPVTLWTPARASEETATSHLLAHTRARAPPVI